jgi:hypothetical protein
MKPRRTHTQLRAAPLTAGETVAAAARAAAAVAAITTHTSPHTPPDQGLSAIAPLTTTGAIAETRSSERSQPSGRSQPFRCGEGVLLRDRRHPGRYIAACRRCDGKGCRDCGPIRRQELIEHYTAVITSWMRVNRQQQVAMAVIADVAWRALANRQRYLARKQDTEVNYLCIPARGGRRVVVTTMPEALRSPYQLVDVDHVEAELGARFHAMPSDQRRVSSSADWVETHKPQASSDAGAGAGGIGGAPEKRYDQVIAFPSITHAVQVAKQRGYYQGVMDPPDDWTEAHAIRIPGQGDLEVYCADIGGYTRGERGQREGQVA